ncbi:MAG: YesL family protein [Lachnospiraceae bacterium]|nr:YesL family protein [Lachnospiraceae bacterium]
MKFLNIDSPLMVFLGKVADLMWVNILTLILCIPIVTAGAAFTAMHYVCLKIVRDEECYITKSYFKSFKENFGQATVLWLLMLLVVLIFIGDFYLILNKLVNLPSWTNMLLLGVALLVLLVMIMIFPVQAKFANPIRGTIKLTTAVAIAQLPRTFAYLVLMVVPFVLGYMFYQVIPIVFLFGFSVPAYVGAMLYNKTFKKIEDRYLEEHPEEQPQEEDDDVRIFSDAPILPDTDEGDKDGNKA